MICVSGKTLPEAYHKALVALHERGAKYDCEWQDKKSWMKECAISFTVEEPLAEPMISRCWVGGAYDLERYRQEMMDGAFDFKIGDGWDYTYYDRMVRFPDGEVSINQIQFVIDELRRCPESRRAVISIRSPYDMRTDAGDPACLQHLQYMIRDNKLHCAVLFRSNDACKATFMNAWALVMIQKKIADELGVEMGYYRHMANSFHCYGSDIGMLAGYVMRIASGQDVTYDYEGEFAEMMEEEKPAVAKTIRQLKERMTGDRE